MQQPAGIVEGSVTLFRSNGLGGGEWWQCSRHTLLNLNGEKSSRTIFWERCFQGQIGGNGAAKNMRLTADRQTDEIWGAENSDGWILLQVNNRLRSGFKPSQLDGTPGPQQLLTLLKEALKPRTGKTT